MIPSLQHQQNRDSMSSRPSPSHQVVFLKKQLQTKPSNYLFTANNKDKNSTTNSFKDMISVPIKSDPWNSTTSLHTAKVNCMEIKTERKENKGEGERLNKKNSERQADYYKYWKEKASQYQAQNFDLYKTNSSLLSQNQILKFEIEKLQKKIEGFNLTQQSKKDRAQENTVKLENIFRMKVEQLIKKISEKQILIQKLSQKINQLTNEVSENSRMQRVIDNMQQRFSEIKSSCESVNDSISNFGYDQNEPKQKDKILKKKYSNYLNSSINNATKTMNHTSSFFSVSNKEWD